jgi:hypothetical protein
MAATLTTGKLLKSFDDVITLKYPLDVTYSFDNISQSNTVVQLDCSNGSLAANGPMTLNLANPTTVRGLYAKVLIVGGPLTTTVELHSNLANALYFHYPDNTAVGKGITDFTVPFLGAGDSLLIQSLGDKWIVMFDINKQGTLIVANTTTTAQNINVNLATLGNIVVQSLQASVTLHVLPGTHNAKTSVYVLSANQSSALTIDFVGGQIVLDLAKSDAWIPNQNLSSVAISGIPAGTTLDLVAINDVVYVSGFTNCQSISTVSN